MAGEEQGLLEQESGVATSLELQAEGVPRPELQLRAGSWSQAGSAPGCGVPEPAKVAQALVCPFARGQRPSQAVPRVCTQLPSQAPCRPGGDLPVTAAAQTPHLQRGDKLPPFGSPRQQLAAGFPTGPLEALAGRAFPAPLQPLVTSAQRSRRILSNKAGARRRPGEGPRLSAEASEPWQAPTPRRAQQEGAAGTRRGERGRKCPAPGAKPSGADPPPPAAPAQAHPAFPVGLGRAEG